MPPGCSLAFILAVVTTRPAVFGVDLANLAEWFAKVRTGASVTLAGTIISIVPILLANCVIIEFHAMDDMVTIPDTDIGVRLYVARH